MSYLQECRDSYSLLCGTIPAIDGSISGFDPQDFETINGGRVQPGTGVKTYAGVKRLSQLGFSRGRDRQALAIAASWYPARQA